MISKHSLPCLLSHSKNIFDTFSPFSIHIIEADFQVVTRVSHSRREHKKSIYQLVERDQSSWKVVPFLVMLLLIFSILFLLLVTIYFFISQKYKHFSKHGIVGPKPSFPYGNIRDGFWGKRHVIYDIDDIYRWVEILLKEKD